MHPLSIDTYKVFHPDHDDIVNAKDVAPVGFVLSNHRGIKFRHTEKSPTSSTDQRPAKNDFDTAIGRAIYGMRLVIGEPPFTHIRFILGLDRLSLRGKSKVNISSGTFSALCTI